MDQCAVFTYYVRITAQYTFILSLVFDDVFGVQQLLTIKTPEEEPPYNQVD